MKEIIVDVKLCEGQHTANFLAEAIDDLMLGLLKTVFRYDDRKETDEVVLEEANAVLKEKIFCIVTDEASNNTKYNFKYSLKCFGHRLNTFLEKLIDVKGDHSYIAKMFHNVNHICGVYKNSNLNRQQLQEYQISRCEKVLFPSSLRLNGTRWTAIPTILARARYLHAGMKETFESDHRNRMYFGGGNKKDSINTLTGQFEQWSLDREDLFFIQPFLDRVKFWIIFTQGASSPTLSFVLYALEDLKSLLQFTIRKVEEAQRQHQLDYACLIESLNTVRRQLTDTFPPSEWDCN